jgi:CheY-like chemotaxis protein
VSAPVRILIVDDVPIVLTSLHRVLERAGFRVEAADSGAMALSLLGRAEVDVVVSDFMMPGMNGIELLRAVAERWPRVRRVMLTAQADADLLDQSLRDGIIHASFQKPWDNKTLAESLRALTVPAA